MHPDKRNRLLTQPPWKLAASATQILCKCRLTKNVCIYRAGRWGVGESMNVRVHVTLFPPQEQSGFVQRAAITALTPAMDERSLYSLELLSYQYSSLFCVRWVYREQLRFVLSSGTCISAVCASTFDVFCC